MRRIKLMGMFYINQGRSKKKKLPQTSSLKAAIKEQRKLLTRLGVNPDRTIDPNQFRTFEFTKSNAALAHSVEQLICNHQVPSSIPGGGTKPVHNIKLEVSKQFTIAPAYNKGPSMVISKRDIKDIGR